MRRLFVLLLCCVVFACNNRSSHPKAENALDAGREFIDAFLEGNTGKAEAYMVDDEENKALLRKLHRQLKSKSPEDQQGYREASIIIGEVDEVTENEVIIQYKSDYDKNPRKVKVVKTNGEWLVDLKYTMDPNL